MTGADPRAADADPMVAVARVSKTFAVRGGLAARLGRGAADPVRAVDAVSFVIPRGRTFALVGESGSGKSTLARLVVGLLPPSDGTVRVGGVPVGPGAGPAERQALRRSLQMIFQDPYSSLNPRWRVGAIVAEPIRALGLAASRREADERVGELLRLVGLHEADAGKYPHEFSGGQRQRIAIARALSSRPDVIVCDEPTSALDVSVQAQILNLMRDLQDRFGLTYLFISHNLAVVRFMADEVGVLHHGRLVEAGPAERIFAAPDHAYTRRLIAAVPQVEAA